MSEPEGSDGFLSIGLSLTVILFFVALIGRLFLSDSSLCGQSERAFANRRSAF